MKVEQLTSVKSIDSYLKENDHMFDEESDLYNEGKQYATRLIEIIANPGDEKFSVKEAMIPLQGEDLWRTWSSYDKEQHRQTKRGKKNSKSIQCYHGGEKELCEN